MDGECPAPAFSAEEIECWIVRRIAEHAEIAADAVDREAPLTGYGLSSRDALLFIGELGELLGREVSPALFWEQPTARALSRALTSGIAEPAVAPRPESRAPAGEREPIAVVGIGCRFPGADDPAEFWDLLDGGGDGIDDRAAESRRLGRPHGLLRDVAGFDAEFFSISAREAPHVDPQQRLLLEVAWEALENGGIAPSALAGTRTGVFVGISGSDYARLQSAEPGMLSPYSGTGQALSIAANRLSYFLDLRGPSIAVDTACSSSLVALHMAVRSLRSGESDLALAGGVNLLLSPELTEVFTQAGMMAGDGRCKTFDAAADGYVRAEGCGLVVLKTLTAARRDGDPVLAVVRGTAVNQDGRSNGLTAPNGAAQQAVVRDALADAGLAPAEVDYVEAHGTGTPLGDPIETRALSAVLGEGRRADEPVLLGSVKTNIGHAEAAAGIAGVIKVVQMLRHHRVPAHLHLHRRNPEIAADAPVRIPTEPEEWRARRGSLTAGVSSFGFGGTNAHVIVQEWTGARSGPHAGNEMRPRHVCTLSARTETALRDLAARYAERLRTDELAVRDVCYTTNIGRSHLRHRAAFVLGDRATALTRLDELAGGTASMDVHIGQRVAAGPGKLAFLFSGQGSQYPGMARQLYATSAVFRDALAECGPIVAEQLGRSLTSLLFPRPGEPDPCDETRYAQPVLFCLEYALARLWMSWGAQPGYLLGHSIGELAAACVAGVFGLADGLRLVIERGRVVQELSGTGAMLVAFAGEPVVREVVDALRHRYVLAVAAVNGAENITVSGEPDGIAAVDRELTGRGIRTKPLSAAWAFHSPMMAAARARFAETAATITYRDPAIPLVSDLDGRLFDTEHRPDADYWTRHLEHTVRFVDGIRLLGEFGVGAFVEVGPGQVLIGAGRRELRGRTWLPSLRDRVDDWDVLATSLARLYARGWDIDWRGFHSGHRTSRVPLPTYPFERKPYWLPLKGSEGNVESAELATPSNGSHNSPGGSDPADPVLATLAQTVATLLETDAPIDPDMSFLELGADSMTLFQTLQSVRKAFGVPIAVSRLFEELNTLRRVAEYIRENAPGGALAAVNPPAPVAPEPVAPMPVPTPISTPVEGAAHGGIGLFLDVHAQVMVQAYELLGGAPAAVPVSPEPAPAPQRPAPVPPEPVPAPAARGRSGIALAPKDTFVAFAPKRAQATSHLTPSQQALADRVVRQFSERTKRSKEQASRERVYHADVRHAPQPYLTLREARYPLVVTRSRGSHVWDLDGNEYIDLTMGFGVNFFGHGERFINDAITDRLGEGMQLGPHSELADEVARLICEMTGKERVVFANTGSEAVMVAVRLARAITGRDKIAIFAGAYHGSADPILARQDIEGNTGDSVPLAPGVTEDVSRNALVLTYGDEASLEVLREHAGELAGVLVEPVQSRRPDQQPVEFLRKLRALTEQTSVPLIFDEVITGFRMHPGGVQALWGIEADITTYGKVVGGGLPIGVVAGKARFLNAIDGGAWLFGEPYPHSVRTFFSGTFCKHPLALAAGRAVLREMRRQGPSLQENLSRRVADLADRINNLFGAADVPVRVGQFGSLFRLRFLNEAPSSELVELFHTMLVAKGLYIWEGRNCFLSTAHTDADVERIVSVMIGTVNEMIEAGFFPGASPVTEEPGDDDGYPLTPMQREIWALDQAGTDDSPAQYESALLDLRGEPDLPALRAAVAETVGRHDSLHTVFAKDGSVQEVTPRFEMDVPVVDLEPGSAGTWLAQQAGEGFDLASGPLVRAAVLRLRPDHHQVYLGAHRVVVDDRSFRVLLEEIVQLYNLRRAGDGAELPPAPRYREFVARREGASDAACWAERFPDGLPTLDLPTDRPRTGSAVRPAAGTELRLGRRTTQRVTDGSRALGSTPFTVLFAAYCCLLHRLSGQDDIVVGVPFACRDHDDADRLVGNCDTVLPVRSRLTAGQTVREYLGSIGHMLADAHEHPGFSAADLAEDPGTTIFGSLFNLGQARTVPQPDGLTADILTGNRAYTTVDLEADIRSVDRAMTVTFRYDTEIFDAATVRRHARTYRSVLNAFLDHLDTRLDRLDLGYVPARTAPPPLDVTRGEVVPLSFAQARLWFLYRLAGPSPLYNIATSFRLTGQVDVDALHAAFADVVTRHESLRTTVLEVDGVASQRIRPPDEVQVDFAVEEVTPGELPERITAAADHLFDLVDELPLRVRLFRTGPSEAVLSVVLHHIAGDAWSVNVLTADLAGAYAARLAGWAPEWSPLPVQYADYTLWQREMLGQETDRDSVVSRQLAFWTSELAGLPDELALPYDRPRPAVPSLRGASLNFSVTVESHTLLLDLARRTGASFFMVAQAALATLLTGLGAGTDIPLGTPVAGRADPAFDGIIGLFANTLVLRTDTSGDPTFRELIGRVRDRNLVAYEHQDVPFEHLVRALNPPRSRSRHPLFQIMLVSVNTGQDEVGLPGLTVCEEPVDSTTAKFDLVLTLRERYGPDGECAGVRGSVEYSTDLFDEPTARSLAERFVRVLETVAGDPELRCGEIEPGGIR